MFLTALIRTAKYLKAWLAQCPVWPKLRFWTYYCFVLLKSITLKVIVKPNSVTFCLFVCLLLITVKTAEPIGPKFCVWAHITPRNIKIGKKILKKSLFFCWKGANSKKKTPPKFKNDLKWPHFTTERPKSLVNIKVS